MDFLLIQPYLDKLPELEDLRAIPQVQELIKKYHPGLVEEKFTEILEERHQEITTARTEDEIKNLDFSFDYYLDTVTNILKEYESEEEKKDRQVLNCLGTIYSKYIGDAIYTRKLIREFADSITSYNTIEYDIEKGARIDIDKEIERIFLEFSSEKSYMIVNSIEQALFLISNTFFRGSNVLMSLSDSLYLNDKQGIKDILDMAGANPLHVGYLNKVSKDHYLEYLGEETLALFTDMMDVEMNSGKLGHEELKQLNEEMRTLFLTDKVYLATDKAEITSLGKSLEEIIEEKYDFNILDMSKLAGPPQVGIIAADSKLIHELHANPMSKMLEVSKESKLLLYHVLKAYSEDANEKIYLESILKTGEDSLRNRNKKVIEKIEEKIGDAAELGFVEGDYLKLSENSNTATLNRELISITPKKVNAKQIEKKLRSGDPAVLCWLHEGSLIFNLQLLEKKDEAKFIEIISNAILDK
jgi:L-seryl-tRNA(Ser) seleniumtransferase